MKKQVKKISKLVMVICINLLLIQGIFANPPVKPETQEPAEVNLMQEKVDKLRNQTIPIGKIKKDPEGYIIKDITLPTYHCKNVSYIAVSDLRQVGGNVVWSPTTKKTIIYDLNQPSAEAPIFDSIADNKMAYLGRNTVYINYQEVPAIFAGGKALIPAKWVALLDPFEVDNPFKVIKKDVNWYEENNVQQPVITGINIWFDGENYSEEEFTFPQLKEGEDGYYTDSQYDEKTDFIYVGFVLKEIDGFINENLGLYKAWLKNPTYYTIPKPAPKPDPVVEQTKLFPATIVQGTMNYAAGGFTKGEQVSVQRASQGKLYFLHGKKGGTVQVPWNSVRIKRTPVNKEAATKEQIEAHINKLNLSSRTQYLVWTDLQRQKTYILKGTQNNWSLIRNMPSSSGMDITPTPRGSYTLNTRVPAFGYGKGYLAKNAYAFIGTTYLYHSVLYDATGKYLLEGRGVLGTKASQGCIRFSPEDSKWFYQTMPLGTAVYIN